MSLPSSRQGVAQKVGPLLHVLVVLVFWLASGLGQPMVNLVDVAESNHVIDDNIVFVRCCGGVRSRILIQHQVQSGVT